jgi:hypothetical protein
MTHEEEENKRVIRRLLDSEAETRAEAPIEPEQDQPEDSLGTTKANASHRTPVPPQHIALDKDNMPLPRRVDELDMDATRVSPVAYDPPSRPRNAPTRLAQPVQRPIQTPVSNGTDTPNWRRGWGGCLLRGFIAALFGLVIFTLIGGS